MPVDIWWLVAVAIFYLGVQLSLGRSSQRDLDEATMLPFADDPEVAHRVERETGRSTRGCPCPGRCNRQCPHCSDLEA
ncbi:cbb3-type cytochrome c oxidase subunit 3 [Pseudomonas sp. ABC1]|uniref:cbb3-type cytochrome oxidase subunit 3 n=1 Tax=Pseudomonas sp. ABC1 TaxID=2748080 RepID=UPI0015C34720|nr:cbb3-type cytochrome c oxidase subunit 3 [Pseudomonas sp. ABC1]QLF94569.1 cbb3-type cytochrome c oxidase subunit 3 [Pseudomonas sp. ABC1]